MITIMNYIEIVHLFLAPLLDAEKTR